MRWKGRDVALLACALILLLVAGATARERRTICEVQEYDENGLSPLNGEIVTVRGVVTFPPGYLQPDFFSIYIQADDCGVNVFGFDPPQFAMALGDSVEVTGQVEEYISSTSGAGATTEIFVDDPLQIGLISAGHPVPEPAAMSIAEISQEENEGRLVQGTGVIIETNFDWQMYLGDDTGFIQVYQAGNDSVDFSVFLPGDTLQISGVILQYDRSSPFFDGYELVPRFQSDMMYVHAPPDTTPPEYAPTARIEVTARTFYPDIGEIIPISYVAPEGSHTTVRIYDLQGRVVRTLVKGIYEGKSALPEFYSEGIQGWDGRDDLLRLAPIGTYICCLNVVESDGDESEVVAPVVVGAKLK